jgi:hypothetical protein
MPIPPTSTALNHPTPTHASTGRRPPAAPSEKNLGLAWWPGSRSTITYTRKSPLIAHTYASEIACATGSIRDAVTRCITSVAPATASCARATNVWKGVGANCTNTSAHSPMSTPSTDHTSADIVKSHPSWGSYTRGERNDALASNSKQCS